MYKISQTTVAYSISYWSEDGVSIILGLMFSLQRIQTSTPPAQGRRRMGHELRDIIGGEQLWTHTGEKRTVFGIGGSNLLNSCKHYSKNWRGRTGKFDVTWNNTYLSSKIQKQPLKVHWVADAQPTWIMEPIYLVEG